MSSTSHSGFTLSLDNVAITVSDLQAAVQWWANVFGLHETARKRLDAIDADVARVEGPGFRLELLRPSNRSRVPEMFLEPPEHVRPVGSKALVFRVDDLVEATRHFYALHVRVVWNQLDRGDGCVSTAIRDNDGNFIKVLQAGASPVI